MHEKTQGSRSDTPNPHNDIRSSTRKYMGRPSSLRPSGRTIWERALVGSQTSRLVRRPPTSPQSASQVRPGSAAHNPKGGINNRVRAHTRACDLRLQTTMICSEASKYMQQQIEGVARRTFILHSDTLRCRVRTQTWLDNRMQELAGPGRRTCRHNRDTGRQKYSQERRAAMG